MKYLKTWTYWKLVLTLILMVLIPALEAIFIPNPYGWILCIISAGLEAWLLKKPLLKMIDKLFKLE